MSSIFGVPETTKLGLRWIVYRCILSVSSKFLDVSNAITVRAVNNKIYLGSNYSYFPWTSGLMILEKMDVASFKLQNL